MSKYGNFIIDAALGLNASRMEVTIVQVLVAVANELAELNEFLRADGGEKNELPLCVLCGEQMLPDVKYQVLGFVSDKTYTHRGCPVPTDRVANPKLPWLWNEINGERVE